MADLDRTLTRKHLKDRRFGPIVQVVHDSQVQFAMTGAVLGGSRFPGFGRGNSFSTTESTAILEAYERFGGYPHQAKIIYGKPFCDISDIAIDPARMGRHTPAQLDSPKARVRPYTAHQPMDWVWGNQLNDGSAILVPADIGFYQYSYRSVRDHYDVPLRRARRSDQGGRARTCTNYFLESSSGCALGLSREEAILHSLLELAERDAFLLAWHAAKPLPEIDLADVRTDAECRHLIDLVNANGYDVHILVTTADLEIPTVWILALNRKENIPASFTAAGASPEPIGAIRSGLWEVCQLVGNGLTWSPAEIEHMLADPWQVDILTDHHRLYGFPETLPRVKKVLGGPVVSLTEAFPEWPSSLVQYANGDLRGSVEFIASCFSSAGLNQVVVVNQSTTEHTQLGLSTVKAVVPGILSMSFGHAQQRLLGVPRLLEHLEGVVSESEFPLDPHPFP